MLLLFLFIYIVISILLFDPKLFIGGDNVIYMVLAESIISGKGYRNLHSPEEPAHTLYPFGFPLLLSLPFLIFGSNVIVLKFLVLLTGIGAFVFMYKICELLFKEKVVIVMAFHLSIPLFIIYNHWILSEMPFLCFSLATVYFFMKAQRDNKEIFYYLSFISATYSFFIRAAGISLILAICLFLVLRKQYKYFIIILLIFLAVFIPWQIRTASIPGTVSYIDQLFAKNPYQIGLGRISFVEFLVRIWQNFTLYSFTILPMTLIPILQSHLFAILPGCFFTLLIIIGFVKRLRKFSIIESYFIFSVIILLSWLEIWSSERFLLSILPIFIIYIFVALFWLVEKISFKYSVETVTGVVILLSIIAHIQVTPDVVRNNIAYLSGDKYAGYTRAWRNFFEVVYWIKDNIPEDKIVLSRKPEFVYLLSKHKSLSCPFPKDYDEAKNIIKKSDYIIADRKATKSWLFLVIEKEPAHYRLVFQTSAPEVYLLQVVK